jgi:hypothetical protein
MEPVDLLHPQIRWYYHHYVYCSSVVSIQLSVGCAQIISVFDRIIWIVLLILMTMLIHFCQMMMGMGETYLLQ